MNKNKKIYSIIQINLITQLTLIIIPIYMIN